MSAINTAKYTREQMPWAARQLIKALGHINGRIDLVLPNGGHVVLGKQNPSAHLHVKNWRVFSQTILRSDIGFAQSYIDGDWESDDLSQLLTVLANNRETLSGMWRRSSLAKWLCKCRHWLNANSKKGSRRNIAAHYDLGNDFFKLWLDETLSYSSAIFSDRTQQTLASAQRAKYTRILSELGAIPGQKILEIGCGFGGFAEIAVQHFLDVYGVTLSTRQLEIAQARVHERFAQFELRDYRDINGQYDHVVSIEMFEAVGREYWDTYFKKIKETLTSQGRAVVQTITIDDALFEDYVKDTDFIQQYIFPGGLLPSISEFKKAAQRNGLHVVNEYAFGLDYAETLRRWRDAFNNEKQHVLAQGFDEKFIRLWNFYLSYCEAGFESASTDVVQFTLCHARD